MLKKFCKKISAQGFSKGGYFNLFQIQDTAHTKGVGIGIVIGIERATIQVTIVIVSAATNRA